MIIKWQRYAALLLAVMFFIGCSRSSPIFSRRIPAKLKKECNVTALVNGKVWIGNAMASYNLNFVGDPCLQNNPISISFWTDLQPGQTVDMSKETIKTTCVDNRALVQGVFFIQIPLRTGMYKLSDLQNCLSNDDMWTVGKYYLAAGGYDDEYYLAGATTHKGEKTIHISGSNDSWLEITHYDKETAQIEGRFEARFRNLKDQEIRFTKATFRAKVLVPQY